MINLHEKIGLPIDHYLIIDSTEFTPDTPAVMAYFKAEEETLFAIRAIPLQTGFVPGRALGISSEECFEHVDSLSRGGGTYRLYIWDYFIPQLSGTIIITAQGLYAEMVRGRHILLTQQPLSSPDIITANLVFPHYRMIYSTENAEVRTILWQAIKFLIVEVREEISPLSLPVFLKGYFEFAFHPVRGYRFFDFNDHRFIAQLPSSEFLPAIDL